MALASDVQQLVQKMNRDVDAVIVEGPNDREALKSAGVTRPIHTCSDTNGIVGFARSMAAEGTVAILTDFDEAGKRLNGRLRELLPGRKVRSIWRQKLGKLLTEHGRRDIESLNNVFAQQR
jgi:5S rRNA maturation endonuclease (ribonuclease M5)